MAIELPPELADIKLVCTFPSRVFRWHTNEEIAAYLLSQESHKEWLTSTIPDRPENGSVYIYSRSKIPKFTSDGHDWKKKGDGRTTREDHMKLKVKSVEKPRIVLVHYFDMNHGKDTQNAHVLSHQPHMLPPIASATFPHSLYTLEGMDFALPSHSHALANTCVGKESVKLNHTDGDRLTEGAVYCPVIGYWNFGSEVDSNRMATTSFGFNQNVSTEESTAESVNEEGKTPLLSPISSGATVPYESPYSELLQWLGNPELSTEGGASSDMSVNEPFGCEVIECHSSNGVHTGATDTVQLASLSGEQADKVHSPQQTCHFPSIVDLAPEWSYPEGGSKVLVVGPWFSVDENYLCLFDGHVVPADLIQGGVLRCFCPAHKPGLVNVQVSCGSALSTSMAFEYKEHPRTMSLAAMETSIPDNPLISISPPSSLELMPLSPAPGGESRDDDCSSWMSTLSPHSAAFDQFRLPQSPQETVCSSPGASPGSSLSTLSIDGDTNPTVVDWCEFLGDSRNVLEQDFTDLSLTEYEQQELYEAATKIQICFRKYKASREKAAAIQIQNFYRRYREARRMNEAAALIQSQYRTYKQHLQFRRAATVIQQGYRHYSQRKRQRFMKDS